MCLLCIEFCRVAFIDVEVKDCEKVLSLNEQEWNGLDLAVKIDETTNIRKKKTKNELGITT